MLLKHKVIFFLIIAVGLLASYFCIYLNTSMKVELLSKQANADYAQLLTRLNDPIARYTQALISIHTRHANQEGAIKNTPPFSDIFHIDERGIIETPLKNLQPINAIRFLVKDGPIWTRIAKRLSPSFFALLSFENTPVEVYVIATKNNINNIFSGLVVGRISWDRFNSELRNKLDGFGESYPGKMQVVAGKQRVIFERNQNLDTDQQLIAFPIENTNLVVHYYKTQSAGYSDFLFTVPIWLLIVIICAVYWYWSAQPSGVLLDRIVELDQQLKSYHYHQNDRKNNAYETVDFVSVILAQLFYRYEGDQALLNLLLESSRCDVFKWDLSNDKIAFMQTWGSVIGLDEDQRTLSTADWYELVHPTDLDKVDSSLQRCIKDKKQNISCDFRIRHISGVYLKVRSRFYLSIDAKSNSYVYGIAFDLSHDQSRINEVLDKLDDTHHLPQENSSELLTRTVRREDVNILLALLKNLRQKLPAANADQVNSKVHLSPYDIELDSVIDMILLGVDGFELEQKCFQLNTLLAEIKEHDRLGFKQKDITFKLEIAADIPEYLQGDASRLLQVIVLILQCSVEDTDNGFVALFVQRLDENPEATTCCLQFLITDSGGGIKADKQSELFASNQKYLPQTAYDTKLYLCHQLIRGMGGKLAVSGVEEKGSTYVFTLNFDVDRLDTKKLTADTSLELLDQEIRNLSILVVDDSETNQQTMLRLFDNIGANVKFSSNGQQAVHSAQNHFYDIIFMAFEASLMDDFEAVKKIRKFATYRQIPIIALTQHSRPEIEKDCLAAEMNGVIVTPMNEMQLRSVLSMWCGVRKSGSPAEAEKNVNGHDLINTEVLNADKAIKSLLNSEETYLNLLGIFMDKYADLMDSANFDLTVEDINNKRMVHTIKSSANYIGAEKLFAVAQSLEKVYSGEEAFSSEVEVQFKEELSKVLLATRVYLDRAKQTNE